MFNHQDNEFGNNKLANLDSVSVNRKPVSENELANKKFVDELLDSGSNLKFDQTLQNYHKVSVGSDVYYLTKNEKSTNY